MEEWKMNKNEENPRLPEQTVLAAEGDRHKKGSPDPRILNNFLEGYRNIEEVLQEFHRLVEEKRKKKNNRQHDSKDYKSVGQPKEETRTGGDE